MYEQEHYFSLFSLPVRFEIDAAALDKQYLQLQLQYHPDRLVGKPAAERAAAMQQAVRVNDAWHTLKSPLKRALYILSLYDSAPEKADEALLMEAMEQREQLEEASTFHDIETLQMKSKTQINACIDALSEAFEQRDYALAARYVVHLQYLEKFSAEIRLKKLKGLAA